jgi:hypothetical protein
MKRALLKRTGGSQDGAIGDIVLMDNVLYRFQQQVAAIETDAVHFSDLRPAKTLGAERRQYIQ